MKFEFETAPHPAHIIPVCDGIDWVRMPLPFVLDHVNCWLLGEPGDRLLIDTGVDDEPTRQYWSSVFNSIGQWPDELLVTHFHPDHMGMAGWFEEHHTSSFKGSEVELGIAHALWATSDDDYSEGYRRWYGEHGLPAKTIELTGKLGNTYRRKVAPPPESERWTFLSEGQSIVVAGRTYEVLVGRGHAPDMLMLFRPEDHVLIAADQVLPSISPNVSVMPRLTDQNPLASFLNTLDQLNKLPDDTLVLPSHGLPFRGLKPRLQALHAHHELRLEEVLAGCVEPQSAYQLFGVLFKRKLDAQQTSFALGETLAHLHYLEHQGLLRRSSEKAITQFVAV